MATQSTVYEGAALTSRTFPSTKHIASKKHMAAFMYDGTAQKWTEIPTEEYELINNTLVLDIELGKEITKLELRVADNASELLNSISAIDAIASIRAEIAALGQIIPALKIVAAHAPDLETHMNKIDHDIASFAHNLGTATAQVTTALQAAKLASTTAAGIDQDLKDAIKVRDEMRTKFTQMGGWNSAMHTGINSMNALKTAIDGIKAQMTIELAHAGDAVTNANAGATEAHHWAVMAHNVQVPEGNKGDFSSMHWAIEAKAAAVPATNTMIESGVDNHSEITSLGLKHAMTFYLGQLSSGTGGGKMVVTNAHGKISPNVIPHSHDTFVGIHTPTSAKEYPDTTTLHNGNYFAIDKLGSGVDYTFTSGGLNGQKVADRDELVWDGTNWHIIGKPDFDATNMVKWSNKATSAQASNKLLNDVFITPKTMHDASDKIMTDFMLAKASMTGEQGKLVMIPKTGANVGLLPESIMPMGMGNVSTMEKRQATVKDMRDMKVLGVYCLPDKVVGSDTMSDTKLVFGIDNKFKEVAVIPMRDKNIFMAFGIDSATGNPVQWNMVIPKLTADGKTLVDADAPKFFAPTLSKVV